MPTNNNDCCPKCQNDKWKIREISVAEGPGIFVNQPISNIVFTAVTCENCSYTDFYQARGDEVLARFEVIKD